MSARITVQAALLVGIICVGSSITIPPGPTTGDGFGVAEARGRYRRHSYRYRRYARHSRRQARESEEVDVLPPERPAELIPGGITASIRPEPVDEPRLAKLHEALQVRANDLVEGGHAVAGPVTPRSISYDFEAGLKTTTFSDGGVVKEPFDQVAAQRLAAPPLAPRRAASAP